MLALQRRFDVPVGYSDHTEGTCVAVAAVALGATVIEKHVTLDRGLPGPDHRASLDPASFAAMVRELRVAESALGSGVKAPRSSELKVRDLVRRSVAARRALAAGQRIGREDLVLLRPGTGIAPAQLGALVGRRASRNIAAGELLQWSDLQS